MKNVRKDEEKKQTPIVDGDARPDKMIEPEPAAEKKRRTQKDGEAAVTSARSADVNKLEDYKDAK